MPEFVKLIIKHKSIFAFLLADRERPRTTESEVFSSKKPSVSSEYTTEATKPALTEYELEILAKLGLQLVTRIKKHYAERENCENPWRDLSKSLDRLFFVIYSVLI